MAAEATAAKVDDEAFMCPVCRELMVLPKLFSCGHTICSLCHESVDRIAESKSTQARCPMCRFTTSVSWHDRPRNHYLHALLRQTLGKKYEKKVSEVLAAQQDKNSDHKVDIDADYGRLAHKRRTQIAVELYYKILKVVARAAKSGIPTIVIKDSDVCDRVVHCLDILSHLLFTNNVAKVIFSNSLKELTVQLNNVNVRQWYSNTDFNISPENPLPPPPPSTPRPAREPNSQTSPPGAWNQSNTK